MKKIALFVMLLLCAITAQAQSKPFSCDTVIYASGRDEYQLYESILMWFDNLDPTKAEAYDLRFDKENLTVIGKIDIDFNVSNLTWYAMSGKIKMTVNVAARYGRVRFIATDVVHEAGTKGWTEGLIMDEIPAEKNKGIGGKQHREVYKRAKKEVQNWFETQAASLASYLNMYQSIQDGDW